MRAPVKLKPKTTLNTLVLLEQHGGCPWVKELVETSSKKFESGLELVITDMGKVLMLKLPESALDISIAESLGNNYYLDSESVCWYIVGDLFWPVTTEGKVPLHPCLELATACGAVRPDGQKGGPPYLKIPAYCKAFKNSTAQKARSQEISIQRSLARNWSGYLSDPRIHEMMEMANDIAYNAVKNLPYKCAKCKHEVKPNYTRELLQLVKQMQDRYYGPTDLRPLQTLNVEGEAFLQLVLSAHNTVSPGTTEQFYEILRNGLGINK